MRAHTHTHTRARAHTQTHTHTHTHTHPLFVFFLPSLSNPLQTQSVLCLELSIKC